MRRDANMADYAQHRVEEQQPGDEQNGEWSRGRLERMNARFVEKVARAIAAGREHPAEGAERK